jgi:cobalt-zinc-cadmium efflux system protein
MRFAVSILLNIVLTVLQLTYAYQAHAVSLLSDALHNLGDVLGLLLAWSAQILLTRQTSERYSYGYKKSTILATLGNALLLFFSVGFIIYEAIEKLLHPHPMDEIPVIFIAFLGIIINSSMALLFAREKKTDVNIKAVFLHLMLDALTSLGVVLAAALIYYTGQQWIDSCVAFIIASIILISSWRLLRHALDLSLAAVPHDINLATVRTYLLQIPGVTAIKNLHIWSLSTQETALTAQLVMPQSFLINSDYQRIQEDLLKYYNIHTSTLQVEQE